MNYHGRILGRYTVDRCLGSGGMGSVWASHDAALGRHVAIKFIRPEVIADQLAQRRFQRELVAMLELSHPCIVRMLDAGLADGEPYLVMELVAGQTLHERLTRNVHLDRAASVAIARELLEALAYMHARGFAHRDIKPANVMLERSGRTVLMDLGLVKSSHASMLTRAGAMVGTPRFMAPEMLAGQACDARMDIYQVGFLLHEMLTGTIPFTTNEMLAMVRGDLSLEPDVTRVKESAGAELAALVANALSPALERRYVSATMMLEDLEAVETGGRPRTLPVADDVAAGSLVRLPEELRERYTARSPLPGEPPVARYAAVDRATGQRVIVAVVSRHGPSTAALLGLPALAAPGLDVPVEAVAGREAIYLVFPERRGSSLADHLASDLRLEVATFDRAVRTLTTALARLHAHGRAHGHISPTTVRFAPDGEAWLGGLELAIVDALPRETASKAGCDAQTTRRLSAFAPPEEFSGGIPTPSGDVFAMARTLENIAALIEPGVASPAARPAWKALIARCTHSDPARRPGHGGMLAGELASALAPGLPPPRRRPPRGGAPVIATGVLLLLVGLLVGVGATGRAPRVPPVAAPPRVEHLALEYRYGSISLRLQTSVALRPRATWWAAGTPATVSVFEAAVATRAHALVLPIARPAEDLRCQIEWRAPGSGPEEPAAACSLPPVRGAAGAIEVEGSQITILGLERRLFSLRTRAEELASAPPAVASTASASGFTQIEAVLESALASQDLDRRLRERAYSVIALLDLVYPRAGVGHVLPPDLSWSAGASRAPDRVLVAALTAGRPGGRAPVRRPVMLEGAALGSELDEDPSGLERARLVAMPWGGRTAWRGRFLAVSVNGSAALVLRDRGGGSGPGHTFDPGWLRRGSNRFQVHRGATGEPIDGPEPGTWELRVELYRRRSGP